MTGERLAALMSSPIVSHLLLFSDAEQKEIGLVMLYLEQPHLAYYYYSFYDLDYFSRNLGMFMMTRAVAFFLRKPDLSTWRSERATTGTRCTKRNSRGRNSSRDFAGPGILKNWPSCWRETAVPCPSTWSNQKLTGTNSTKAGWQRLPK